MKHSLASHGLRGLSLLFAIAIIACGGSPAHLGAEVVEAEQAARSLYRPALGAGVDFAETKTYGQCVTVQVSETPYGMSSLYDEVAVRDRHELDSILNVDASVSAKTLWGNGGASASYFKNVHMSSDAFYWLVYADYKLRDRGLDMGAIVLTPAAKAILKGPRGLAGFYEACGEYFYSGAQQSAIYALLYEFHSAEEKTLERIKAAASYDGFGVKAKASFEKFAQMAMQTSVLKVHAASSGGSERLRSYATNPEQLEEELSKLRQDLYSRGTGVNTQWFMSDYNMFPEVQEAKAAAAQASSAPPSHSVSKLTKEFALARLYHQYVQNVDVDQQVRAHLERASGDEPLLGYSPAKRQALYVLMQSVDRQNVALGEKAKECMLGEAADSCALGELLVPAWGVHDPALLMRPDHDFTTLQGWSFMASMRPGSKVAVDFVGKPPEGGRSIDFHTGHTVQSSPLGLVAGNDLGQEFAVVIGTSDRVGDPTHGQLRPNVCVYAYKDVCSLRMVPLPGKRGDGTPLSKLQLVLFDSDGFVQRKCDFPPMNADG